MALGPDGVPGEAGEAPPAAGVSAEELSFVAALEGVIDRALQRSPPGEPFVYGIHQEIGPAARELLERRYRDAGWSRATLKEGPTGAHLLVLSP